MHFLAEQIESFSYSTHLMDWLHLEHMIVCKFFGAESRRGLTLFMLLATASI